MVEFNPLSPEVRENPYPIYKALRDEDPVHWSAMMQSWLLTRYDDIQAVLKDPARFSSDRTRATSRLIQQLVNSDAAASPLGRTRTMLSSDPPNHTRMRTLVNKAFTPRVVERMRPHIQEIADDLLDALPEPGHIDAIRDLAAPLPMIVIAETLGVSPADRLQFRAWSSDIAASANGPFQPPAALEKARQSSEELAVYFQKIIGERRKQPKDDLLSALIAAEEQGDLLTEDELLLTCMLLLIAGNETTTNLIGNGMLALMANRDELRSLEDDPSLIVSGVEEMLRYDGPAQATSRVATGDWEVGGKKIEAGQMLIGFVGAANRDPAQFEEPERLDLRRADNHHLAFGQGIHYCIGAPLARAEAQTAITTLLRRLPDPELNTDKLEWKPTFILRGVQSLPVVSKAAAR